MGSAARHVAWRRQSDRLPAGLKNVTALLFGAGLSFVTFRVQFPVDILESLRKTGSNQNRAYVFKYV
jgi:hypothetical protein